MMMEHVKLTDVDFSFTQTKEAPPVRPKGFDDSLRSPMSGTMSFGDRGYGNQYTAGRTTIGQVTRAKIETQRSSFARVLLRDVFCLVHEDMQAYPADYLSA